MAWRDPGARAAALVALAGAVAVAGLIALSGENPVLVLWRMLEGSLLSAAGLSDAVTRSIPLCLVGLGIAVAFRANVFNIGADGQLLAGAAAGATLAPVLAGLPVPLGLALMLAGGMAGGAIWGGIAGVLRARFAVNEIIATIMLNYIALQALGWLLRGPLQEPTGIFPRSARLAAELRLPVLIEGTRISAALLLALIAVFALWVLIARSRHGYELTVAGRNAEAARFGGIRPGTVTVWAMLLSGGFAGLAGVGELAGVHGRIQEGFGAGFGITGIAVALLARLNPLWVPVSAFGFSTLYVGSAAVARSTAVPFPLVHVVEAVVILAFLALTVRRGGD